MLKYFNRTERSEEIALNHLFSADHDFCNDTSNEISRWSLNIMRERESSSQCGKKHPKIKIDKVKRKDNERKILSFHHFKNSHDYIVAYRDDIIYDYMTRQEKFFGKSNKISAFQKEKAHKECYIPIEQEVKKDSLLSSAESIEVLSESLRYAAAHGVNINITTSPPAQERKKKKTAISFTSLKSAVCVVKTNSQKRHFSPIIGRKSLKNDKKKMIHQSDGSASHGKKNLKTVNALSRPPNSILLRSNSVVGQQVDHHSRINQDFSRLTPAQRQLNVVRKRVPQTVIPHKNNSFKACIMPMSV